MQSARTLRSHIFIWTCGWRGITLLPHCTAAAHWLVCTCDLCLGQYLGHIILPTPTSRAESSRQCIFAYDWHPFRFSCIVFSGPPNAVNWPAAVAASPHIFTQTCAQSIDAPLGPLPSSPSHSPSCCPLAFRVLSLFDAPLLRQISALFVHYWPRYTSPLNELLSKWMYATLVYLLTNTATYSNSNSNSYAANRIDLANRWPPPRLP